jgi:hypothetical protein
MPHEVFSSYSSNDKTIADAVVASMEGHGSRYWYAHWDIRSGDDWEKAITTAIENTKLLLLIFSGHTNQSQRVLDELMITISCENTIIPFRLLGLHMKWKKKGHVTI